MYGQPEFGSENSRDFRGPRRHPRERVAEFACPQLTSDGRWHHVVVSMIINVQARMLGQLVAQQRCSVIAYVDGASVGVKQVCCFVVFFECLCLSARISFQHLS